MSNIYTIREYTSGKLVSHQFNQDDADLDARIHSCNTMRWTYVVGPDGATVAVFDQAGNRINQARTNHENPTSKQAH